MQLEDFIVSQQLVFHFQIQQLFLNTTVINNCHETIVQLIHEADVEFIEPFGDNWCSVFFTFNVKKIQKKVLWEIFFTLV